VAHGGKEKSGLRRGNRSLSGRVVEAREGGGKAGRLPSGDLGNRRWQLLPEAAAERRGKANGRWARGESDGVRGARDFKAEGTGVGGARLRRRRPPVAAWARIEAVTQWPRAESVQCWAVLWGWAVLWS
jgi:hypothetical protein